MERVKVLYPRRIRGETAQRLEIGKRLLEDVLVWIDRLTADLDHVMEVRTGRESCTAHEGDHVAPLDTLPLFDQGLGQVPVDGFHTVPMVDSYHVAHL